MKPTEDCKLKSEQKKKKNTRYINEINLTRKVLFSPIIAMRYRRDWPNGEPKIKSCHCR